MQKRMLKHLLIMVTLCGCLCANAQDSPLTLWCYDIHAVNPAMAGSANQLRLNTFYRNQWLKADAGFQYYGASADMPVAKNMGAGIGFSNDHAAAFAKPGIYGTYSYTVKTGLQSELRLGIRAGVMQKYLSASDLTFEQTEFVANRSSKIKLDAGIGAGLSVKNFFAGISFDHLTRPRQEISGEIESRTSIKMTLNAGFVHKIRTANRKKTAEIMPILIFQQHGRQQNLQFGVIGKVNWMLMGIACRKNIGSDAPWSSIILGYKVLDFRIAYSYDFDLNKKTVKMGNAHEISITKLSAPNRKEKHKSIDCPSFLR